ncbi:hypothetical protein NESM_000189900 [Novymonas esmeraldas]|uniref:Uncharacterized protein n=1 Tax=Novymonas esmeraldas TaxID=1808958 RepID=A0AAW0F7F7_9TRYP
MWTFAPQSPPPPVLFEARWSTPASVCLSLSRPPSSTLAPIQERLSFCGGCREWRRRRREVFTPAPVLAEVPDGCGPLLLLEFMDQPPARRKNKKKENEWRGERAGGGGGGGGGQRERETEVASGEPPDECDADLLCNLARCCTADEPVVVLLLGVGLSVCLFLCFTLRCRCRDQSSFFFFRTRAIPRLYRWTAKWRSFGSVSHAVMFPSGPPDVTLSQFCSLSLSQPPPLTRAPSLTRICTHAHISQHGMDRWMPHALSRIIILSTLPWPSACISDTPHRVATSLPPPSAPRDTLSPNRCRLLLTVCSVSRLRVAHFRPSSSTALFSPSLRRLCVCLCVCVCVCVCTCTVRSCVHFRCQAVFLFSCPLSVSLPLFLHFASALYRTSPSSSFHPHTPPPPRVLCGWCYLYCVCARVRGSPFLEFEGCTNTCLLLLLLLLCYCCLVAAAHRFHSPLSPLPLRSPLATIKAKKKRDKVAHRRTTGRGLQLLKTVEVLLLLQSPRTSSLLSAQTTTRTHLSGCRSLALSLSLVRPQRDVRRREATCVCVCGCVGKRQ